MSVELKAYSGESGNHAFQYFTCLIYCKKHNLKLITKPSNSLLEIFQINYDDNNNYNNKLTNKIINSSNYDKNNEIIYY